MMRVDKDKVLEPFAVRVWKCRYWFGCRRPIDRSVSIPVPSKRASEQVLFKMLFKLCFCIL